MAVQNKVMKQQIDKFLRQVILVNNDVNTCVLVVGCIDPKVLLELFSTYRNWQEDKVQKINKKQVCPHNITHL